MINGVRAGAAVATAAGFVFLGLAITHASPAPRTVQPAIASAEQVTTLSELTAPERSSIAVISLNSGNRVGTANDDESRPALSIAKLYLVEYAIEQGDDSDADLELAEQAIRYSDDSAADQLDAEYPGAIEAIAQEYGLTDTYGTYWGTSYTSAADVASFLDRLLSEDPSSPILAWMSTASPVAADGTDQDWGTSQLTGVEGSKWGWSDEGPETVASASYGKGFIAVAMTDGDPDDQTDDVLQAIGGTTLASIA